MDTRLTDLDPKRARLWGEVGDAEQQSGDLDGAIRDFQKALAQDALDLPTQAEVEEIEG